MSSRDGHAAASWSGSRDEESSAGFPARMNYIVLIVTGLVIGFIVAAPIGPVNLICIRRTLAFGSLNGFLSGLGGAMGDGVYAAIVGFGLTAISQWIEGYSQTLQMAGGALLLGFGVHTYLADPLRGKEIGYPADHAPRNSSLLRAFASTFAIGMGVLRAARQTEESSRERERVSHRPDLSSPACCSARPCGG